MGPRSQILSKTTCVPFILIAILAHSAQGIDRTAHPSANLTPVIELAHRVVPWMDGKLGVIPMQKEHGEDVFELSTELVSGDKSSRVAQSPAGKGEPRPTEIKLLIRASDPVSAAMGLNYYLKYYCHRSMSHVGNNLAPVKSLPPVTQPVHRTSRFKYRYFLNYCTLNYSFAFADWTGWERELDWMALEGINLALAANGTEAVWQNTLRRIGYSQAEILQFIPGPAYTAWWLMGNLEGWGGAR